MKQVTQIMDQMRNGELKKLLEDIYVDQQVIPVQESRYIKAMEEFIALYGEQEVEIYSAAGRSEVGGNHTDHQQGMVLATSINLDVIAVVSKNQDASVRVVSEGYKMIELSAEDLEKRPEEEETSIGLIRGVLRGFRDRGYETGGFNAYMTSDVLGGSGLSSSAAFETVVGTIIDGLYNEMRVGMVEIAQIGQFAENVFFGKPSGLMDQMACAVGGLIHIDFKDPQEPKVEKVDVDFEAYHYSLCIVDVKASHSDLTYAYALVPEEMKKVCGYFGKKHLREIAPEEFYSHIAEIRKVTGDRAVLRAIHFYGDNERVQRQVDALRAGAFHEFLQLVKESGDSSFKYLQNIYTNEDVQNQSMSVALAVSEHVLGEHGVCRVHGGGFAGTIQAFVENDFVEAYRSAMDAVFGAGSCHVLKVRKYGGLRVI